MNKFLKYLIEGSTPEMVNIGGNVKVSKDTKCEKCGADVSNLKFHDGMLGFEGMKCKKCGHVEDLNKEK